MNKQPLTLDDITRFPLPGMIIPGAVRFSPDGRALTYLHSSAGSLVRELYIHDLGRDEPRLLAAPPGAGVSEENISRAEQLRRERLRQRALGVTSYSWHGGTDRLLVPLPDGIYIQQGQDGELTPLVTGDGPFLDPRFSPDGAWVAYVYDGELHCIPAAGGEPQQITSGARETGKTNGLAEYIAAEELDRYQGYWWSPDNAALAFVEVDERHIPPYTIMHQGKNALGEAAQETHRYPFAGAANAVVRLGVVPREGGEPVWMDLGRETDIYLARVTWRPDGRLTAQLLNRAQTELRLLLFDPQTGEGKTLLTERSEVWINLHHLYRPLRDGRFLWASEKSGFRHLYLHDTDGTELRPLTSGSWMVEQLPGVDQKGGRVFFTATRPAPTERHLFVVSLDGGEPQQLTREPGMHQVTLDRQYERFVDIVQAVDQPPRVRVCSLADGQVEQLIVDGGADPRLAELELPAPELVTLTNREGDLLYGALYPPPASFGEGPFPTIVSVYGGPHAQRVTNSWGLRVDMRAQYLAQQGFLVFKLDNRGSARRGVSFEAAIRHNMGDLEVQDQADGVRWLAERGLADADRVGVYGWSYGGYMALMCLARAPQLFRAAVAGAPVTHWDGYDTAYTERYMGTPQNNPDGYEISSVMAHINKIGGKLLLVHGLIDENVHFRHTARLLNALIAADRRYELLLFPEARHMPRSAADRRYMEARVRDFFAENLG